MKIEMPIKVISEANQREHWTARNKRKHSQQCDFASYWRASKPNVSLPCKIIWTRYASRLLDADNLAGSFKFCQDQFAREIGVDDGSELLEFEYRQEKLSKREYYISVEVIEV